MIISNEAKNRLSAWWNHEEMDRPCFMFSMVNNIEAVPDTEDIEKYWTDVDFILSREMALIDNTTYFCEAVPYHYVNLGSVPLGGCLGGDLSLIDKETTWNVPFLNKMEEIRNLDVRTDNKWWSLVRRTVSKSAEKSSNHHYVAYPAFSGMTDIISSVIGLEPFLYELVDNPDDVKSISAHLLQIWARLYRELAVLIDAAGNDGHVGGWTGVWSPGSSFPLQEDISYMFSSEMFREFCLPCIDSLMQLMDYPYYHLDGKGSLKFVDSLLQMERLKVIQWVPGAGNDELSQWHDLIGHILNHGKSVHVYAKEEEVGPLIKAVGSKGLLISASFSSNERLMRFAEKLKLY
jgi:hypothetical protein